MMRKQSLYLLVGLLLVLSVGPGHAAGIWPWGSREPLVIVVETEYPSANAQTVADSVAAPIEQQVNGVEGMRLLRSRCSNDGKYLLAVTFAPGTDLKVAQVLVQNRVALALPTLPDVVKQTGVTVRKQQPGMLLMASLTSSDGRHNAAFLEAHARRHIHDELARQEGVGGVELVSESAVDEKPALAIAVHPVGGANAKETTARVREALKKLDAKLPRGLRLDVTFAAAGSAPTPMLLNVALPPAASPLRVQRILEECSKRVRRQKEVRQVVALSRNPFQPFDSRPCLLVSLDPDRRQLDRTELVEDLHKLLKPVKNANVQPCPLSTSGGVGRVHFPIDFAVCGPEVAEVRKMAQRIAEQLRKERKLRSFWCSQDADPVPQIYVAIDREKMLERDVDLKDISTVLEVYLGKSYFNEFHRFGRTWQVTIETDNAKEKQVEGLKKLKVRNRKGNMVPLAAFTTVRLIDGPQVVDRIDMQPLVSMTANLASGELPGPARKLCESVAEEARKALRLPATYKIVWLP